MGTDNIKSMATSAHILPVTIPDNFITKVIVDKTLNQHHWIIVWYVTLLGDKVIVRTNVNAMTILGESVMCGNR